MKKTLWILAATAAALLLMLGVYRATRPVSVLMSEAEAQTKIEDLAARFSAAIENKREVGPLLEQIKPIVDQRPNLRDGRKLLGQVYAQLGRVEEAYVQFDAALRLDPNEPQLQNLAGTAAMMLGRTEVAEAHHRRAVELAPGEPALKLPLADVLVKTGRYDAARLLLLRALEQQLSLHEASALMSDVYAQRGGEGDLRLAIGQMEEAVAKLPVEPRYVEQRVIYARKLARLYAAMDDPMEAIAVLDSLHDAARFSPEVLAEMAGYFEANGQAALAGLQYAQAAERRPGNADLVAEAGRWYLKGGDRAAARLMLRRLEGMDAGHPAVAELRAGLE